MLVLGLSSKYVRVIIVGRIIVPGCGGACGCQLDCHSSRIRTNIACGSSRHRGCGYALGSTL